MAAPSEKLLLYGQTLAKRVRDGVIRKLIDKWLKAGIMEDGRLSNPTQGTPQGGSDLSFAGQYLSSLRAR